MRLLLAGLVGALLASIVFLSIELARKKTTPPPLTAGPVAVDPRTGAPIDPQAPAGRPDPFGQLFQRMTQGFGQMLGGKGGPGSFSFSIGADDTSVEVEDAGNELVVVARVKDAVDGKFDVRVRGGMFTLRGERRLGGLGTMSFEKTISLPADVDPAKMTQSFKDGVLRVRLPKR